jgi:molecular chaperone GrpE
MTSHGNTDAEAAGATGAPPTVGDDPSRDVIPELAPAGPAPDIGELLQRAETEAAELKEAWLRARADVENIRRQSALDLGRAHKYAVERFAADLLPVKDALESTLAADNASPDALRDGVDLTLKQLVAAFEKAQITEIDPAGAPFDPHQHQAMTMLESAQPANTVVQVFQKGYRLSDRVLRPALVAVARANDAPDGGDKA